MAEITSTPVGLGTQELRIATAMTGGVSLAIWMGGVARELNLLEQAARQRDALPPSAPLPEIDGRGKDRRPGDAASSRALYLRLLDVLDMTVHVDILSGTSAGGINGALLAFTRARRLDLGPLRDVWLNTGSFDLLLRNPSEKSPPSLLQGDDVLLKGLNEGIGLIARGQRTTTPPANSDPGDVPSTTVFITTTLLAGETSRFTDAFGTLVQDDDHRGLFRFKGEQLMMQSDEQVEAKSKGALALAARCSASFPAAFEPAFVPWGASSEMLPTHPDMAPYSNTTRDHFVADGGLMMNRPIKPLLEAIFDRPAERQVRRTLLYVVPSPGDAPDPTATPPTEEFAKPYTFGKALLKDLGAALNQSISAELRAIREHNDNVGAMADTRLRVAELGAPRGLELLQPAALADYRDRESAALARSSVTALMRAVTTMASGEMPESWRNALKPGTSVEDECRAAATAAIAAGWPATVPSPDDIAAVVRFGRAPFDGAKATAIAILRAGWTLASSPDHRRALANATSAVHHALWAPIRQNVAEVVTAKTAGINKDSSESLAEIAAQVATEVASTQDALLPALQEGWQKLAQALIDVQPILSELSTAARTEGTVYGTARASARSDLATYLAYLGYPQTAAPIANQSPVSVDTTISRLFQLFVVVRSMLPVAAAVEQRVELVQVSADTRNHLSDLKTAQKKLTGMQFHHFGAFYKSSWRANDWMWGRLDGAGWLVHLMLDPRRILVLAEAEGLPHGGRVAWFLERLAARIPDFDVADAEVAAELAYLDDPNGTLPPSLPNTSRRVAIAWQRRVALAELPVVAREIVVNPSLRTSDWAAKVLELANDPASVVTTVQAATAAVMTGKWNEEQTKLRDWATSEPPPTLSGPETEELIEMLRTCPVPQETLKGEVGEPLFTRTVTKATAVVTAATAEAKEMPVVLKPVLATVRAATLLAYRVATVTRGSARLVAGIGAGLLVLGVILASTSYVVVGVSGLVLMSAGIFLLLVVGWSSFDTAFDYIAYILLGLGLAVAGVLFMDRVRSWLFDHDGSHGFISRTVLPWLRDPAWHAPLAFLGFVTVVLGAGYLLVHNFDD
jgi:patatin-related protein